MTNKSQSRAVSLIFILFFSVSRLQAGIGPEDLKTELRISAHDSSIKTNKSDSNLSAGSGSANLPAIPLHPSMNNFIDDYSDANDVLFEKLKVNKANYFVTIDKIFTTHNIPVELKYMAIVESKLKTNAVSGVGAVGVWQFMPATAKTFGLKITSKYDERQHLWKSTAAAAKYLDALYQIFDDWLLVVASYNSGPAPVLNAIKKSGSRSFWKLQNFLPKETRLHVKRFIATHYYFEGKGSMVTIGKAESEKYLSELEDFLAKSNLEDEESSDSDPDILTISQWVAVLNDEYSLQLILKK